MSKRISPVPLDHFPASIAPVGSVVAVCCPQMAGVPTWWDTSPVTQIDNNLRGWTVDNVVISPGTFGFDDRTNIPKASDRGTKEYWNRSGAPGSPAGRLENDGASWVSVPTGGTAEVELTFVGQAGASCISNASVTVDFARMATIAPTTFTTASNKLTVTGVLEGECTVTVSCGGKPIGWFHVAVYDPKIVNVTVWRVNLTNAAGTTDLTSAAPLSASDMATIQNTLDTVYAQCTVSWNVTNGGVITYTNPVSVTLYNNTFAQNISPSGRFIPLIAAQHSPATLPNRNVYYLQPLSFASGTRGYTASGGTADGIPSASCTVYAPITSNWGRGLLAHELGHCLSLYHPNDSRASSSQLPNNFRLPLAGRKDNNVMYSDHINMMGYGAGLSPSSSIRYGQWKAIRANT